MKDIHRRSFLKKALLAGAGAAAIPAMVQANENMPAKEDATTATSIAPATGKKVIVAGAGITGLCCGYELMKAGHEVTILEATGRYGGHVYTGRDGLRDG